MNQAAIQHVSHGPRWKTSSCAVLCRNISFSVLFSLVSITLVGAPLVAQTPSKELMKQEQTESREDAGVASAAYQAEPAWNLNPDYVFGRYILPLVIALVFLIALGLLLVFVPKPNTSSESVNHRAATPSPTSHSGN